MKNSINGPMKKAVMSVPSPGSRPQSVPTMTQIRSHPMRQKRNGFLLLFEIMIGIASYTETPRSDVIYREEAKHITTTAISSINTRTIREGDGTRRLIVAWEKSAI